jgi:hypothetical protein
MSGCEEHYTVTQLNHAHKCARKHAYVFSLSLFLFFFILCVNETKLDSTINDHEVCFLGFELVRRDRIKNGRNGGGVCIYIRSNLNFQIRDDLKSEIIENLTVEIKKPRFKVNFSQF